MYGKNFYDIWVEKYGQEVANDMEYNRKEKRKLNYMKKTKEELDIIENKRIETRRKNKELMNENR